MGGYNLRIYRNTESVGNKIRDKFIKTFSGYAKLIIYKIETVTIFFGV